MERESERERERGRERERERESTRDGDRDRDAGSSVCLSPSPAYCNKRPNNAPGESSSGDVGELTRIAALLQHGADRTVL